MDGDTRRSVPERSLFDEAYYLAQTGQLADGQDAFAHFRREGAIRGIDPHPLFSMAYYMSRHADEVGGRSPLEHYVEHGRRPGYDPHPLFDGTFYLRHNRVATDEPPLLHYAAHGCDLALRPHPAFVPSLYAAYRKLPEGVNPLVDFVLSLRTLGTLRAPADPVCSVIVLNHNKAVLTVQSVVNVLLGTGDVPTEVIVVDNGSRPDDFALLASLLPRCAALVRLDVNRFFGEGNNLGVERSHGRYLLFLNNDAFVGPNTIATLLGVLRTQFAAGAAVPKFVFPDGRLQEAGAFVDTHGTVIQRGRLLADRQDRFAGTDRVDYGSAACLMTRRSDFDAVGGFDLTWDPAYYEDVDLCLKLELIGKASYYCGDTTVVHLENGTSADAALGLRLDNVVAVNREKFISRWSAYLADRDVSRARITLPASLEPSSRSELAVLFTPYALVPGGGERYILTFAQHLARTHRVVLVTPAPYSSYRLRGMAKELRLDLSGIELLPRSRIDEVAGCDLFVAMGNEMLPQITAMGKRRIYICQFPFPMHPNHVADAWGRLEGYDMMVVYSDFVARNVRKLLPAAFTRRAMPIAVVPPPVPRQGGAFSGPRVPGRILNVGRFARAGHCKRQDALVEAFKMLRSRSAGAELELHLVGTVAGDREARDYLLDVRRAAHGHPVYFHLNAPPETLEHLYRTSSLYWHATGYGVWEQYFPERLEHFGISVIEAMSAGTIPLVCANGGPASIVDQGRTGFHWTSVDNLADLSYKLLERNENELETIRRAAEAEARRYDPAAFEGHLATLLSEWPARSLRDRLSTAEREVDIVGR